VISDVTC